MPLVCTQDTHGRTLPPHHLTTTLAITAGQGTASCSHHLTPAPQTLPGAVGGSRLALAKELTSVVKGDHVVTKGTQHL